jgi:hypothetical protein
VRTTKATAARCAVWLACLGLGLAACRGLRASTVPLGGTHVDDVVASKPARPAASAAVAAAPSATAADAKGADTAGVVSVQSSPSDGKSQEPLKPTAGAFQVKPYSARQTWTRLFDLEFDLKVGPGGSIDMKMVSHQEVRFEVLSVGNGSIDKLAIEYSVYTSKMTIMGQTQDSPEELNGKKYVVTFAQGKPEVRDASGNTPPKKQLDSVKDDAREPLEIEKGLKELSALAAKGRGDFSAAGAVALAGGEDEDTKVSRAKASLQKLVSGSRGEKTALLDVGYTLINTLDDKTVIEVQVAGPLSVLDAPARFQTSTLQGPMEIRSSEPGGMQGRGTLKVTTSYKY